MSETLNAYLRLGFLYNKINNIQKSDFYLMKFGKSFESYKGLDKIVKHYLKQGRVKDLLSLGLDNANILENHFYKSNVNNHYQLDFKFVSV